MAGGTFSRISEVRDGNKADSYFARNALYRQRIRFSRMGIFSGEGV